MKKFNMVKVSIVGMIVTLIWAVMMLVMTHAFYEMSNGGYGHAYYHWYYSSLPFSCVMILILMVFLSSMLFNEIVSYEEC